MNLSDLEYGLQDSKLDDTNEDNRKGVYSSGVFLVQCQLNSPETTAVKHFLPPATLDNNIEGEITSVQFW